MEFPDSATDERSRLQAGGSQALAELLSFYGPALERIVRFRLEPYLKSRIDPADVLQESYFEIARRIQEFIDGVPVSFFIWIRQRTLQTMVDLQRNHLREKRNALREVSFPADNPGQTSCLSIARFLLDDHTSPSQAAVRAEELQQLQKSLESMDEIDREVLVMRHFEHLSNQQVAEVLGISITAASNRYIRAAARLGDMMKSISSGRRP